MSASRMNVAEIVRVTGEHVVIVLVAVWVDPNASDETVADLGARKEELYKIEARRGVNLLPGVRPLLEGVKASGWRQAIGSSAPRENVELIVAYENKLHDQIGTKLIARSLLDGLFLEDVRQMRDEIYARHGKIFKAAWTQKYFASFDWYKPDPNFNEASLSEIEKRNIATITAYERKAVTADSTIEG